jgi:hypothetical protein
MAGKRHRFLFLFGSISGCYNTTNVVFPPEHGAAGILHQLTKQYGALSPELYNATFILFKSNFSMREWIRI